MLERRKMLDPDFRAEAEEKMCRTFLSLASFRYAETVLTYAPLKYELDLSAIAKAALEKGKKVAFPRCEKDTPKMVFRYVEDPGILRPDTFGIREPPSDAPLYVPSHSTNDVCIIPALAYDLTGCRLGYGKGYYDRYLPAFGGAKIGFALSDFIEERLPRGRYDLSVDIIITEKGVVSVNEA